MRLSITWRARSRPCQSFASVPASPGSWGGVDCRLPGAGRIVPGTGHSVGAWGVGGVIIMRRLSVIVALGALLGMVGGAATASPALAGRGHKWEVFPASPAITLPAAFPYRQADTLVRLARKPNLAFLARSRPSGRVRRAELRKQSSAPPSRGAPRQSRTSVSAGDRSRVGTATDTDHRGS